MHTVVGRLVSDAKIAELQDGRKVVNFTIAQNARFKVKGSDEVKQVTNYYNCAYWMGTGIATHLKKGVLIESAGRVGVNVWQSASGEAKASLTLHVQQIQLHGKIKDTSDTGAKVVQMNETPVTPSPDDLPF